MLETAKKAALNAAPILLENFGKIRSGDIREKNTNDFLTFVDEKAEEKIIATIHETYPDHSILAEESGAHTHEAEYRWIIDPLDGTKNFITGLPVFGISVAVQRAGETVAGVIYDPLRREMYSADKGKGAFCENMRLQVSSENEMIRCLVATGFPFRHKDQIDSYMACFAEIFRQISGVRRMGAASLDLAWVAAGKFDAFWELGLCAWDMAAGTLLISEAGGICTDFWGGNNYLDNSCIVCSNGLVQDKLLSCIKSHFPAQMSF